MKRYRLKILSVLLLIPMILSMTSCAKTSGDTMATDVPSDSVGEKVEIIAMVQSSPEAEFVQSVADSYMAEPGNENITVTINQLGRDDAYPRIQNQLFTMSDGVDFFFITPNLVGGLAEGGVLEELDGYFDDPALQEKGFALDNFTPGGIKSGSYGGHIYGLPFVTSTMLLFYRTDLIDTPPQTWDEYRAVAEQFTRSINPDSPTTYGTTVFGKPQQDAINLLEEVTILWSMGGELVDADGVNHVKDDVNVEALTYWADLYKDGLTPPDANTFDYTTVETAFQSGDVAMCIQWDAAAGDFANPDLSPEIYDKYAVSIIPGTMQADGSILRTPYLNNWISSVNKFSSHKAETMDFLAYMYDADVFTAHLTPGMTTALNGVLASDTFRESKEANLSYEAYKESLEQGRGFVANPNLDKIASILDAALNLTMTGSVTPEQALSDAYDEIQQLFD